MATTNEGATYVGRRYATQAVRVIEARATRVRIAFVRGPKRGQAIIVDRDELRLDA